jgi:type VI secretion system secreted protein Hcp
MAFDAYMTFMDAKGGYMQGESQVAWSDDSPLAAGLSGANVFEIDDFNFDFEQVINIGSQSSGGGAGRVTFNAFTINRKFDRASPTFMTMCCAGTHFKEVSLLLRRAGAGATTTSTTVNSGTTFLRFDFALVLIKTIAFSGADGDEACKEEVAMEYGAVKFRYLQQNPDGSFATSGAGAPVAMWNRVNNNNDYDTFLSTFTAKG